MHRVAEERRSSGHRPFIVPLGASTPTGALGLARGVAELAGASLRPDVIVHSSSSAGTQAGLLAGCALFGLRPRIIGVSADESAPALSAMVRRLIDGMADRLGAKAETLLGDRDVEVDAGQIGPGYGIETDASIEATSLVARREGILLDPVYTAKAMAGLIALVRAGAFAPADTVLFWHTGGIPGFFV